MIKKIVRIVSYSIIAVAIFTLLGFAVDSNKNSECSSFLVHLKYDQDNFFVEQDDVMASVNAYLGNIEGRKISDIKLDELERIVKDMIFVEKAHAYKTIDSEIHVIVAPRKPLVRIVNAYNQSYYIDTKGKLMPVSRKYTARVPVVFGNVKTSYSALLDLNAGEENYQTDKLLQDIFILSKYIAENSFWNAFIDQIYITSKSEFELIPKSNIHTVEFGGIDDMEEKFRKLKIFYIDGLTKVGWRNYNRINIKYNNQVVCSK
ncbi:MAG: hypothetical protein KGZ97_04195 [Bacteroidetes bacterium]|nr:hypothetical protein [Bacteroidota bacterium]